MSRVLCSTRLKLEQCMTVKGNLLIGFFVNKQQTVWVFHKALHFLKMYPTGFLWLFKPQKKRKTFKPSLSPPCLLSKYRFCKVAKIVNTTITGVLPANASFKANVWRKIRVGWCYSHYYNNITGNKVILNATKWKNWSFSFAVSLIVLLSGGFVACWTFSSDSVAEQVGFVQFTSSTVMVLLK